MKTISTTISQATRANARLRRAGYDIQYIETRHTHKGDYTYIIWGRLARPDELLDFPLSELPF